MERLEAIRAASGSTLYVYSFVSLFVWQEHEKYAVCLTEDAFLVRHGIRGDNAYLFPCGSERGKKRLIDALLKAGRPTFYFVGDGDKAFLENEYPGTFVFDDCRDDYPYLYDKNEQIALPGKEFKNLRHQIHLGRAAAEEWSSEPLTAENADRAREITRKWAEGRDSGDPTDVPAIEAALDSFGSLKLWGVLFRADGEDVAYVLGTFVTPEIFDICFCKVLDGRCDCFIKREFYLALPDEVRTVDSEEDMGIEGLRKHKLLRRPKELVRIWKGSVR
ncbi:MAG: DUF2156 domain-containing protein [Clostridia bacterium]|nr:DUF2156 domain-containing protein [Clostridia bacterium]